MIQGACCPDGALDKVFSRDVSSVSAREAALDSGVAAVQDRGAGAVQGPDVVDRNSDPVAVRALDLAAVRVSGQVAGPALARVGAQLQRAELRPTHY